MQGGVWLPGGVSESGGLASAGRGVESRKGYGSPDRCYCSLNWFIRDRGSSAEMLAVSSSISEACIRLKICRFRVVMAGLQSTRFWFHPRAL